MNKLEKFILIILAVLFVVSAQPMYGQSKKETKAYNKALKTGTVESLNLFIGKFPQSVYVPTVEHMIDSIHFSAVNQGDMASCLEFMGKYPASSYNKGLEAKVFDMALAQRYNQNAALSSYKLLSDFEDFEYLGNSYYRYTFVNYKAEGMDKPVGKECEYVVNMLDKRNGVIHVSMFSGKVIEGENGYMLEGDYVDESSAGQYTMPEALYLLSVLKEADFLLPVAMGDVMTDQAIEWWNKNNPANAKRLKFGLLPKESSIVEMFGKQREYESSGGYKVAFFDIRGYTVVAAYQKKEDQYMLVWAEPVCKDTKRDPFINTIYFENANSLVLYYYKGRTTYKVRVNMANKTIAR